MCGIAGVVDFSRAVDPVLIERMCATMSHRGPDSRGIHIEDGVGLGVQRLAVIDPISGQQPVHNETHEIAVVFNGEIYNHRELRKELSSRGHILNSFVDTEVIPHLYEELGVDLVTRLHGMFAFAIWDRRGRRLVCARDRVGKKPLFWSRRGARFTFASELLALLEDQMIERRPDPQAIDAYLALQYVPHSLCAVQGVHKLSPACTLIVEPGGSERIERYWEPTYVPKYPGVSRPELDDQLRTLIGRATARRLESDVPLGALLSGGVDSSAVVANIAEHASGAVKTFSVGFDDPAYDETAFARRVAARFATDHHELRLGAEALELMPRLARHYGEPFGDSSAVATFKLAELASAHVKVVLTGDGGDEAFGGYDRYVLPRWPARAARVPSWLGSLAARPLRVLGDDPRPKSLRSRVWRVARLMAMEESAIYTSALLVFDDRERASLLDADFPRSEHRPTAEQALGRAWDAVAAEDRADRMMGLDLVTYLPDDLLVKMDIATMAHSVEARSPFLDLEVIEFAAALPVKYKLDGSQRKKVLKSALRGIVPDATLARPKMGFGVPVSRWLRDERPELAPELLLDRGAHTQEYLRRAAVESLLREHAAGVADRSMRIWVLMMLELWHREVLSARR